MSDIDAIAKPPLLTALLPAGTFANGVWPQQAAWAHGATTRLPLALQRVAQAGVDALFDRYRGPLSFGRGARDVRSLDVDAHPSALFRMGLTVHLHDAAAAIPDAAALLRSLEQELQSGSGSARLAVFASPRGDGLPLHYDAEDVISIQLIGRKRFEVAPVDGLRFPVGTQFGPGMIADEVSYAACPDGFPDGRDVRTEAIEMQPGSVLVLPRGTWHRTEALEDSLSVSIVVAPMLAADAALAQLRELLYGGARDRWAGLLRELPAVVAQLDARTAADGDITPASRFQRIPTSTLSFRRDATALHLTVKALDAGWIERTTLDRPAGLAFAPVLDWLATSRAAFDAGSLAQRFPSIAFDDLRLLLKGLVQVALLQRLPGPALARAARGASDAID